MRHSEYSSVQKPNEEVCHLDWLGKGSDPPPILRWGGGFIEWGEDISTADGESAPSFAEVTSMFVSSAHLEFQEALPACFQLAFFTDCRGSMTETEPGPTLVVAVLRRG